MCYNCFISVLYIYVFYRCVKFKFAAIKVSGFEIMTYSRLFNFTVSYQNYFMVSYTNVVFSYTNKTLCVKDQVLRLEHRLGLMEILKNLKINIFV